MYVSECCSAKPYLNSTDYGRCSDCKEWCEFILENSLKNKIYKSKNI